jgi:hypothetical protein
VNDVKPTGAEIAKSLPQVDPETAAKVLLELLESNPAGMEELITNREWTRDKSVRLNSGWPANPGTDHKTESTERGRTDQLRA